MTSHQNVESGMQLGSDSSMNEEEAKAMPNRGAEREAKEKTEEEASAKEERKKDFEKMGSIPGSGKFKIYGNEGVQKTINVLYLEHESLDLDIFVSDILPKWELSRPNFILSVDAGNAHPKELLSKEFCQSHQHFDKWRETALKQLPVSSIDIRELEEKLEKALQDQNDKVIRKSRANYFKPSTNNIPHISAC